MSETTKKNEVTLTREEFVETATKAILDGEFIAKAKEKDPSMGFMLLLMSLPIVREIEKSIFGKEEKENGTE